MVGLQKSLRFPKPLTKMHQGVQKLFCDLHIFGQAKLYFVSILLYE